MFYSNNSNRNYLNSIPNFSLGNINSSNNQNIDYNNMNNRNEWSGYPSNSYVIQESYPLQVQIQPPPSFPYLNYGEGIRMDHYGNSYNTYQGNIAPNQAGIENYIHNNMNCINSPINHNNIPNAYYPTNYNNNYNSNFMEYNDVRNCNCNQSNNNNLGNNNNNDINFDGNYHNDNDDEITSIENKYNSNNNNNKCKMNYDSFTVPRNNNFNNSLNYNSNNNLNNNRTNSNNNDNNCSKCDCKKNNYKEKYNDDDKEKYNDDDEENNNYKYEKYNYKGEYYDDNKESNNNGYKTNNYKEKYYDDENEGSEYKKSNYKENYYADDTVNNSNYQFNDEMDNGKSSYHSRNPLKSINKNYSVLAQQSTEYNYEDTDHQYQKSEKESDYFDTDIKIVEPSVFALKKSKSMIEEEDGLENDSVFDSIRDPLSNFSEIMSSYYSNVSSESNLNVAQHPRSVISRDCQPKKLSFKKDKHISIQDHKNKLINNDSLQVRKTYDVENGDDRDLSLERKKQDIENLSIEGNY